METERDNWLNFFSTIKESNIKFNPKPWEDSLNTPAGSLVFSRKDKHGEIAKKVDELIAQMNGKSSSWETVSKEIQTVMKT